MPGTGIFVSLRSCSGIGSAGDEHLLRLSAAKKTLQLAPKHPKHHPACRGKSGAVLKPEVSIGAEPVRMMSMKYQPAIITVGARGFALFRLTSERTEQSRAAGKREEHQDLKDAGPAPNIMREIHGSGASDQQLRDPENAQATKGNELQPC